MSDSAPDTDNRNPWLERAARAAGTTAAVHVYAESSENAHSATCGRAAEVCRFVCDLAWGKQSCRLSREHAATKSIRRRLPIPFVCHMGFSCVSMALDESPEGTRVLTLGPFLPSATPEFPELEVREGLERLRHAPDEALPFPTDDVPVASADAVPEVALWIAESIVASEAQQSVSDAPEASQPETRAKRRRPVAVLSAHWSQDLVAALVAGDSRRARELLKSQLQEYDCSDAAARRALRFKALGILAAAVQSAAERGLDTKRIAERLPGFVEESEALADEPSIRRALLKTLAPLKPHKAAKAARKEEWLSALDRHISKQLPASVTLTASADAIGLKSATLTKRLQRKFGLSFSDYVGRSRVDKAKRMLRDTKLSVSEVSQRVGVTDASNFGKLFRKHAGMSPRVYRKRFAKH